MDHQWPIDGPSIGKLFGSKLNPCMAHGWTMHGSPWVRVTIHITVFQDKIRRELSNNNLSRGVDHYRVFFVTLKHFFSTSICSEETSVMETFQLRVFLFQGMSNFEADQSLLFSHLSELRVFKTPEEIEVIRYANKISSEAHREVMRNMQPNRHEYQYESLFHHHVYAKGSTKTFSSSFLFHFITGLRTYVVQ